MDDPRTGLVVLHDLTSGHKIVRVWIQNGEFRSLVRVPSYIQTVQEATDWVFMAQDWVLD
jgi:hypothetical protein